MKIEWLLTDVTAVGTPGRAERAILEVILGGQLAQITLIKIDWFVANVTAVVSPARAERATYFGDDFGWAIFC